MERKMANKKVKTVVSQQDKSDNYAQIFDKNFQNKQVDNIMEMISSLYQEVSTIDFFIDGDTDFARLEQMIANRINKILEAYNSILISKFNN
jgi:hypothetical protein